MQREYNVQELEAVSLPGKNNRRNCAENLDEVLGDIIARPASRNIAIEFECGECCKKVLNGESIVVADCFVILRPAIGERLVIKLFSGGELVERQRADIIVIPIDHICSIEFGAEEID